MNVLVINAGSSSLKYQLIEMSTEQVLAKGLCERIGIDGKYTYEAHGEKIKGETPMKTHSDAIRFLTSMLVDEKNGVIKSMKEIDAVGHRVVSAGEKFSESVPIKIFNSSKICPSVTGSTLPRRTSSGLISIPSI